MAEATEQPQGKKKLPLKMIITLAAVLILEAAAITGAFMLAGGPSDVEATTGIADAEAEANRPVEVDVTEGKFQNTRSGQPFLYDTKISITVKNKHKTKPDAEKLTGVDAKIKEMQSRINDEITTIFRRAEPAHLDEPDRKTISRQIHAALDRLLGVDADGEKYVIEVLIPRMRKYSTDI